MCAVNALIAEHFPDLVDAFEAANDELFKKELGRNPELQILLQHRRFGQERCSEGPACLRIQDWCFHFEEVT